MAKNTPYASFNRPSGKPGKSAGGGRLVKQGSKSVSHSNEVGTPGQSAGYMASMGNSDKYLKATATASANSNKGKGFN